MPRRRAMLVATSHCGLSTRRWDLPDFIRRRRAVAAPDRATAGWRALRTAASGASLHAPYRQLRRAVSHQMNAGPVLLMPLISRIRSSACDISARVSSTQLRQQIPATVGVMQHGNRGLAEQLGDDAPRLVALHRDAHPGVDLILFHIGPQAHGASRSPQLGQLGDMVGDGTRDTPGDGRGVATLSRALTRNSEISLWSISSIFAF